MYSTRTTLRDEGYATSAKFLEEMASVCFTYGTDFYNLVDENKRCAGEDQSKKIDLILVDLLYDVQRDWKELVV